MASNDRECLSGIIKLEVSLSLYLLISIQRRTRGGGVLIKEDKRMFMVTMIIRKSIKEKKTFFYSIKFLRSFSSSIRLTNLSNCKMRCAEENVFFCYFSFHHSSNMSKFHIFNAFFYFAAAAYIQTPMGEKKKKRKKNASFMSGVFLCASPFSQVTRLKVKKSDKFDIPSTFCDYLKRREKEKHQISVFFAS